MRAQTLDPGGVFTFVALGLLGHLYSVVGREDPTGTGSHVVALIPVILRLDLHQQRVIYLQLQLIVVSGDKPARTDVVTPSQVYYGIDIKQLTGYQSAWTSDSCQRTDSMFQG